MDAPPLSIKLSPAAVELSVVVPMPLATAASSAGPICPLSDAEVGNATLDAPSKDEVTEKKLAKITN